MVSAAHRPPLPERLRVPAWAFDVLAAMLILGLALVPYPGDDVYQPKGFVAMIVSVSPAILLPFRRRWPIPVLAACVAIYGALALAGTLSIAVALACAIAAFGVAVRSRRRTATIATAAAVLAIVGLSLLVTIVSVFDPRAFQMAITVAFAGAAGDATRSRRAYIQAVTDRAERAEQTRESEAKRRVTEERLRIARDLHDAVAHQISVISLNAGVAASALESRPDEAKEALGTIRAASRAVLGEIGDLLELLRAGDGGADDQLTAPQPGLDQIGELLSRFREAGLDVTLRVEGDLSRLPIASDLVAFRVIQEALTNAHKHGSPPRAHVLVAVGAAAARIIVTNPVAAPEAESAAHEVPGGHGLIGIRERVASVRGTVETGPSAGGYQVLVNLPFAEAES